MDDAVDTRDRWSVHAAVCAPLCLVLPVLLSNDAVSSTGTSGGIEAVVIEVEEAVKAGSLCNYELRLAYACRAACSACSKHAMVSSRWDKLVICVYYLLPIQCENAKLHLSN